ncbi:MAG: sulfatase-like hydrolase/transferase [Gemmatimonadota bacterium]
MKDVERVSPLPALRDAAWFALAAGLLEAALLLAHGRLIHGFIYLSPHLVWMAPLSNLAWFGIPVASILLLSRVAPRLGTMRATWGICLFLAALSILLLPSQLHWIAAVGLALGIAIQGTRILLARRTGFDRLVRRTLPLLVAGVLVAAMATIAWGTIRERRQARLIGHAREGAPNIIFIVLDTVRRASLSLYGYNRPTTPGLERWAKRGVLFQHAFSTASWTLPSHASMFSGRFPNEMSAAWLTPLDDKQPLLAERLRDSGYLTAGFVANLLYCNREFGLARGFVHYEDYQITPGEFLVNSSLGRALSESHFLRRVTGWYDIAGRKPGRKVTDQFLAWREANGTRPYFAFLNYFDAHQPYFPPPELASRFGPTEGRNYDLLELRPYMGKIEDAAEKLTPTQVAAERNSYDATLAYLDQELDRLLTTLDQDGSLKNTIIVIASDHGEQFGEHGLFDHGNSLYRFTTEVPLIILGNSLPRAVVDNPVSLRDLPATLLDLSGSDGRLPGESLRPWWTAGARPITGPVISETAGPSPKRRFQATVSGGFHAIWSLDSVELYDFSRDSAEMTNLATTPSGIARLGQLRASLDSAIGSMGKPR